MLNKTLAFCGKVLLGLMALPSVLFAIAVLSFCLAMIVFGFDIGFKIDEQICRISLENIEIVFRIILASILVTSIVLPCLVFAKK